MSTDSRVGGLSGEASAGAIVPAGMGRAVWVSVATMASRVLGLIREQFFAGVIGNGDTADAYVAAFRIPNLLRDLFAEGALSSAFIPTFADYHRNRGRDDAYRLANAVVALVLLLVGGITLLGVTFAPQIVHFIAPGFNPAKVQLAAKLTRIMMPFLVLVSLSAVAMGMLNAQSRFTAPALAPALFNIGSIAVGTYLWISGWPLEQAVVGWSIGTLIGGALQLGVQLPSLLRLGYRPAVKLSRKLLAEPGLRRIGGLMAAAVVGLSATQINIVVNTQFASNDPGGAASLGYAFRLMQLPLGVFGVAIATVAGAGIAQRVAARDMKSVRETLGSAMRLVAFLNVPAAVGLMLLAMPIISLIFNHGRFNSEGIPATAEALVFYAVGLYGYSAIKVYAPAFYALDEARIPVIGSFCGMGTNVLLNFTLYPVLGFPGVALGTSAAAFANFAVLAVVWRRRHGGLEGSGVVPQLLQVVLATGAMAAAVWAINRTLPAHVTLTGIPRQLVLALVPVAAGAVVYFATSRLLRVKELDEVATALRRRRRVS